MRFLLPALELLPEEVGRGEWRREAEQRREEGAEGAEKRRGRKGETETETGQAGRSMEERRGGEGEAAAQEGVRDNKVVDDMVGRREGKEGGGCCSS